ncbi:condensation domain-containing protein [Nonomuraea polychroma]|uniref:Condensation domain-containing protein n=1 Tax=Nonomuraea polychroma TaxID=46176 RepID=A0A438LXW2_9ACTN|nr:condensation domain-containing protein [Nonomuraea polychroma]RVX38108.1 condensation domain-containing protein [Nonomuraea polychroma]
MMIDFAGGDSGMAPLTWGQRAIWETIERTAPDDHYFNFGRVLKVPGRRSPHDVAAALGALVERHGSLRTRTGDQVCQRLEAKGRLPVQVVAGDPDEVLAELAATRFDYAAEWPLRAAIVVDGSVATYAVLVFCHLAADGHGAEVALRDLRALLLKGGVAGPPPPRPLDLARWQAGPEGRRVAEAAAAHWETVHRRTPATMFATAGDAPDTPPIRRALLRSPALRLAVGAIALAARTSTSTVLLTATAKLAGRFSGEEQCTILPIVANRFRRDTLGIVSTLSQEGLFALDVGGSLADLLPAAAPAAMRAYRSAYHDPADRARIVAEESRRRGEPVHPNCCFNDLRLADPGPAVCAPADIEKALPETSLEWQLSQDKLNCRFCVHVTGDGVSLTADTRHLSRARMERYLYELEALLVETACR